MSFALFWLGEYANVLLMCALNAIAVLRRLAAAARLGAALLVPGWIWLFAKICVLLLHVQLGQGDRPALPL